ncbi:MAG: hypothetical protein IKJ35_04140 [Clostridia bacterium]|nr:hypothetical protein [Clostridia bacterium]
MKKYILIILTVIALVLLGDVAYYRWGWYVDLHPNEAPTAVTKTEGGAICIPDGNGGWQPLQIRGVTVTAAEPGVYAGDFTTDRETYLAWFAEIDALGANTLRVPSIMSEDFYRALYEYNQSREKPLYLIQGISIDEYVMDSTYDVFSERFVEEFRTSCLVAVDVIHGTRKLSREELPSAGWGDFTRDVSPWVLGWVLGSAWEPETVAYANDKYAADPDRNSFNGVYLHTAEGATPVEAMLAYVGDSMISYETRRYKEQRVFGFFSTDATDPLTINISPEANAELTLKTPIDTERILCTDAVLSGRFAAYALYPYSTDRLAAADDAEWARLGVMRADFATANGGCNNYAAYLRCLKNHHTVPVLIAEFGTSSSRAPAKFDWDTGRHFGSLTEREQGEAIVSSWNDIVTSGCAGGVLAAWQDDWGRSSATRGEADPDHLVYWSDFQSAPQGMGLLTFEPGESAPACTVDGDPSEWSQKDLALALVGGSAISVRYDEKFVYLMVKKPNLDFENDTLLIPIDTTQESGSNYCRALDLKFARAADFLLVINGKENSRLLVQERYDLFLSGQIASHFDQNLPDRDSAAFHEWRLPISTDPENPLAGYETGRLRYGNANPASPDYDSLADFAAGTDCVEIRLPWQLLHFSNPSSMEIHSDYYENHGVTYHSIDRMYVGLRDGRIGFEGERIAMGEVALRGWLENVTYHARLKESYFIVRDCWNSLP